MKRTVFWITYLCFTLFLCPYLMNIVLNNYYSPFFIYQVFLLFFPINFITSRSKNFESSRLNLDLLLRFLGLFCLNLKNFFLFLFIKFNKIINYLYFKSYRSVNTLIEFYNIYFAKISLTWRPIFKRFSYFGYFRTYRNKWLNK